LLLALLALSGATGCASLLPTPPSALPSSAQAGDNTIVVAAQGPPRQTLPQFLGSQRFLQALGVVVDRVRNRLGSRFPGLEATPPLLAITDPANAQSAIPSVAAAAAAKAEEDAAPQKIKAIRYLAKLGCKECYPDTMSGLLAGFDDCTEAVRYETAKALRTLTDGPCKNCKNGTCCTPDVVKKLDEVVNGRTETGLPSEPSERVRRMARMALENCNCAAVPAAAEDREVEGPLPTDAAAPAEGPTPAAGSSPTPASTNTAAVDAASSNAAAVNTAVLRQPPQKAYDVVVARVNDQAIHYREIAARVEQRLAALRLQAAHDPLAEAALVPQLFREELQQAIDRTLLVQEARRTPEFAGSLVSYEAADVPAPHTNASTNGASLSAAVISDDELAAAWLRRQLPVDDRVSDDEIRTWYQQHREEFRRAAEIRWERVTAAPQQFGSADAARSVLQEVRERAESLAPPAPPSAEVQSLRVESFDWTSEAAIPSNELAEALRVLPIGRVSEIVNDGDGLHVVRVLARRPQRLLALEEVYDTIHARIVEERRAEPRRRYLDELRRRADVWTMHS
jgi:hypothetical protein